MSEHVSGSAFVVIEFGLSIMVACPWLGGGRFIYLEDRWTSVVRKLNWSVDLGGARGIVGMRFDFIGIVLYRILRGLSHGFMPF